MLRILDKRAVGSAFDCDEDIEGRLRQRHSVRLDWSR